MSIDIWRIRYFRDDKRMQRLNEHVTLHSSFQLHQVAVATGCDLETARLVLDAARDAGALTQRIAIYNRNYSDSFFMVADCIPNFHFTDEEHEEEIESEEQIRWEPIYVVTATAKIEGMEFFKSQ
jgi:hypothetical protein